MLRGYALAILLLAGARTVAAQQTAPPLPCPTQASSSAQSTAPSSGQNAPQQTPPADAWHCITVQFQYDFSKTPPCAGSKPKHPCVAQFAIYETTAGTNKKHRIFLFYVPLPAKPSGVVQVTGESPKQIDFVLGAHKLSVGALDDTGKDSHMKFCDSCATWINVQAGPTPAPSTPAPGTSDAPPGSSPPSPPAPTPPTR
jgi:hypothetical protein